MLIIVKVKDAGDIIGLKEEIAMRLEGVIGIERIDVFKEGRDDLSQSAGCSLRP